MVRPELYFDTQVIRDAADGVIDESDWKRTAEHVGRRFRHRISPVTLYELLSDIAAADESDFERHRGCVRHLFVAKKNKYLRLPRHFAAEHLFGDTRSMPNMEPDDFDVWGRVVLAAADRNTLMTGVSMKEDTRMRYRLDLQDIDRHLKEGEAEYRQAVQNSSEGDEHALVDSMLRLLWREPGTAGREKIATGLSAALALNRTSVDSSAPWLRVLQLFYLCAPELILVTSGQHVLSTARSGTQSERIWSYDRLKREAGVAGA